MAVVAAVLLWFAIGVAWLLIDGFDCYPDCYRDDHSVIYNLTLWAIPAVAGIAFWLLLPRRVRDPR